MYFQVDPASAPSKPPVDPNLPNCLTVGAKQLLQDGEDLASPIIDTASAIKNLAQEGLSMLSDYFENSALIYSATRINTAGTIGLLVPLRSSTYRGLVNTSEGFGTAASALPLVAINGYLTKGVVNELQNPTYCNNF